MIEEQATVVQVDGDIIVVEAMVKSTCNACEQQSTCGTGSVARAFSHKMQTLELSSPVPVSVGDTVLIGVHENSVLTASFLLYVIPLVTFVFVFLGIQVMFGESLHELVVLAFSAMPTWLSFNAVRKHCQRLDKGRFQPVILKRVVS